LNNDFSPSDWYSDHYSDINVSADPDSLAFRFLHQKIEKSCPIGLYPNILEVGSNNGEHVAFVPRNWSRYVALDLRLPSNEIYEKFDGFGVSFEEGDVQKIPYPNNSFDRIISTCVMHHVNSPESAFREMLRVAKSGGIISIAVPNDPGLSYRFLRHITSVRRAKRMNLEEELNLVHALEHKNHFLAIEAILKWVFKNQEVRVSRYPNIFRFWHLNFLTIYTIRKVV